MDRAIRRDIEKRYRKMLERFKGDTMEISCYACEQCGQVTKVRQEVVGLTHGGIECPYCHGQANLDMFDQLPNVSVTHEWYRPTIDEVLKMAEEDRMFSVNFVLSGGLMRRECSKS